MTLEAIMAYTSFVSSLLLAIAALGRKKRSLAHWAFAAAMILAALDMALCALLFHTVSTREVLAYARVQISLNAFQLGAWLIFALTYGRAEPARSLRKWRLPIAAAFLLPLALPLLGSDLLFAGRISDESAPIWMLRIGVTGFLLHVFLLIGSALVLVNLEQTFRSSIGVLRWQVKYMLMGVGVLFISQVYRSSQVLLTWASGRDLLSIHSTVTLVAEALIFVSFFRAGFGKIDICPSPILIQRSLTMLFVGLYLALVGLLAKVMEWLGRDYGQEQKTLFILLALVLLALLLLSDRLREGLKRFVSRHIARPVHDYRKIWTSFVQSTTAVTEEPAFCRVVTTMVSQLFNALSVSLWRIEDQKLCCLATTGFSEEKLRVLPLANSAKLTAFLQDQKGPFDLDASSEPALDSLKACTADFFQKGGNRICVQLSALGQMLGLMVVGDRVNGIPFSMEDLDLLKCVGDQTASGLLNLQLSQRLMHAKELEAFQAMSSFFVHDLKNTASTLTMMLRNLPKHFEKPEFREDALRAVSASANHIQELIKRLSVLRGKLEVKRVPVQLNEIVLKCLADLPPRDHVKIKTNLGQLASIPLDPDQMGRVVLNLLLNAIESIPHTGLIQVETSRADGQILLNVTDNGCGMTPDFIQNSLFKPFRSTKKSGLGIGMFQCQTIVAAHGGRIHVESQPGRGTVFQVILPCQETAS